MKYFTIALLLLGCAGSDPFTQDEDAAACVTPKPDPQAFPCTSDATCGLHKCNLVLRTCQWPCGCDSDCQPGAHCAAPFCMTGAGDAGRD